MERDILKRGLVGQLKSRTDTFNTTRCCCSSTIYLNPPLPLYIYLGLWWLFCQQSDDFPSSSISKETFVEPSKILWRAILTRELVEWKITPSFRSKVYRSHDVEYSSSNRFSTLDTSFKIQSKDWEQSQHLRMSNLPALHLGLLFPSHYCRHPTSFCMSKSFKKGGLPAEKSSYLTSDDGGTQKIVFEGKSFLVTYLFHPCLCHTQKIHGDKHDSLTSALSSPNPMVIGQRK